MTADISSLSLDALLRDVEQWQIKAAVVADNLAAIDRVLDAHEARLIFDAARLLASDLTIELARRLREQETANSRLRHYLDQRASGTDPLTTRLRERADELESELSLVRADSVRLAEDSERLDWLEQQKPELIGAGIYQYNDTYWSRHESDDETLDKPHRTMRAAIDAAIQAGQQETATEKATEKPIATGTMDVGMLQSASTSIRTGIEEARRGEGRELTDAEVSELEPFLAAGEETLRALRTADSPETDPVGGAAGGGEMSSSREAGMAHSDEQHARPAPSSATVPLSAEGVVTKQDIVTPQRVVRLPYSWPIGTRVLVTAIEEPPR